MVAETVPRVVGGAILATGGWESISATPGGLSSTSPGSFGLSSAGVILGLLATPHAARWAVRTLIRQLESVPTSRLLSATLGLLLGLLVAVLISIPIFRLAGWLGIGRPIALSIFLAYLGAALFASPRRDVFQKSVSDGVLGRQGLSEPALNGRMLVDTSAIIDGRIADISHTGFLRGTLVVPKFVLDELRHVADSNDSLRRNRGRRGLELLNKLRQEENVPFEILDVDRLEGEEVDSKLVSLATELKVPIVTTDYNLNRVAQI